MELVEHLHRLFRYDAWANREVLTSLRAADSPPPRSLRFLAHILAAERLWLDRWRRDRSPVVVWPEHTLEECEAQAAELTALWQDSLQKLTDAQLAQPIPYVNTKGEQWTSPVGDILLHVVLHSAYHRGQIATDMRATGHTPAYTDFIHCIRQGFLD